MAAPTSPRCAPRRAWYPRSPTRTGCPRAGTGPRRGPGVPGARPDERGRVWLHRGRYRLRLRGPGPGPGLGLTESAVGADDGADQGQAAEARVGGGGWAREALSRKSSGMAAAAASSPQVSPRCGRVPGGLANGAHELWRRRRRHRAGYGPGRSCRSAPRRSRCCPCRRGKSLGWLVGRRPSRVRAGTWRGGAASVPSPQRLRCRLAGGGLRRRPWRPSTQHYLPPTPELGLARGRLGHPPQAGPSVTRPDGADGRSSAGRVGPPAGRGDPGHRASGHLSLVS